MEFIPRLVRRRMERARHSDSAVRAHGDGHRAARAGRRDRGRRPPAQPSLPDRRPDPHPALSRSRSRALRPRLCERGALVCVSGGGQVHAKGSV